ncbi:hypothetical protein H8958_003766, partial [Nasalis larvatus]
MGEAGSPTCLEGITPAPGQAENSPIPVKRNCLTTKCLKQCSSICQGNGGPECQSPGHPARENSGGAQGVQPRSTQPPRSRLIRSRGQAEPPTSNRVPTKQGAKNVSRTWSAALLRKSQSRLQEPGRDPGLVAEGTPG